MSERGDIWLGVTGMVVRNGKVLVVKKSYGATKGLWTLPGGFVNADETIDMAAVREVHEETGIIAVPEAIVAVRSGVLRKGKHDTLLVFRLREQGGEEARCEREIETMDWLTPEEIVASPDSTEFLASIILEAQKKPGMIEYPIEHRRDYGYSTFKMFM